MSDGASRAGTPVGWALVAVQFGLLGAIALWPRSLGGETPRLLIPGIFLLVVGGAVGLASVLNLGGALTPLPEPNGAGLSARGLYRWVRHPMYLAVMTVAAGVACLRGSVVAWCLAAALPVLFEVKTRVEERWLVATYDGYAAYASRTGKYLPGIAKRRPAPPTLP